MNDLSLFIYFADVLPSLGGFAIFLAIVSGVVCIPATIVVLMAKSGDRDAIGFLGNIGKMLYLPYFFLFFFGLVGAMTPSTDTIYLIAASEAGEMVVQTPEAQKVMTDLKEILNIQLQKLKQ